ncbi:hypothetical protein A2W24_04010 [Microgenomates group bacterium RBG_16_45_19]|nr:MAG: hypothetical protein A2W24_04010 [Microgenomates group bacterium RBG_16_45_19]
MLNAFTVDLEDWYQGLEIPDSAWQGYESRIEYSTNLLLDLLDKHRVKATFFILGPIAEKFPDLVKRISRQGHEIGSHAYSHQFLYRLSPEQLRQELIRSKCLLEDITGKKVTSFRAPFFSITKDSLWALEILSREGFQYDSSIFPVHNYRYGIPKAPKVPFQFRLNGAGQIIEFPISTVKFGTASLPFSGGAYFRLFPYGFTRFCFRKLNNDQIPVVFYIHPWELDPEHPRIKLPRRISLTHYANLKSTKKKLDKLLQEFRFTSLEEVLRNETQGPTLFPEDLAKL